MPESPAPRVTAAHALGIYAESLVSGRRVLIVGDATDGLGARMVGLGARLVHVYDPDPERATAAAAATDDRARGVSVRALPAGDFDVRDGAFDVALVPDLATLGDPAALLARVRRLVGSDGVAVVAAPNPEAGGRAERDDGDVRALDYYELYDLVSLQFASVRMIGQVPFHGVAIAELGEADGAPQVSVDTQLVPDAGAPDLFIALASQHDVRLDPYAIVQLPFAPLAPDAPDAHARSAVDGPSRVSNAALAEAQLRAELLEAQLEEQRVRLTKLSASEAHATAARTEETEALLQATTAKLRENEARAGDNHVRAERLALDVRALEEELQRQRDRALRLTRDLEEEKKARTRAELDLGMMRKSPELAQSRARVGELEEALRAAEVVVSALQRRVAALEEIAGASAAAAAELTVVVAELEAVRAVATAGAASTEPEATADELVQLEGVLRERAQAIQTLEREVHRRERMVQELVAALEEAQRDRPSFHEPAQVPAMSDLHRKLDALASEVAKREGDAQASAWRIAELEQELAAARSAAGPAASAAPAPLAGDLERRLAAACDELDVVKQALAQEHEARKKSESGEDLARAKADLQRQATLIEQLSRELDARDADGARGAEGTIGRA